MARRLPLVVFVVVGAVGALELWLPCLTASREVISQTPSPPALYDATPVRLRGHDVACLQGVTFDRDSEVVGLTLAEPPARHVALVLSAAAPGYRARATARPESVSVRAPIAPPARSTIGRLCIANAGRGAIALAGTAEPGTASRPVASVNGAPIGPDIAVSLYRRRRSSYLARAGDILRHASTYTWGVLGPAALALLAVVLLVGVPAGVLWGLADSLREDSR